MKKSRIDAFVHEHFNLGSLEDVRRIIMAGKVLNNNQLVYKPSEMIDPDKADIRLKNMKEYVSRGGMKLKHALTVFNMDIEGTVMADIGSSTGGFTDCALKNGASHVYAVDVGTNQLHYRLRMDERVTAMEQTNFKHTVAGDFPSAPLLFTIDVSFTSIVPILRHIKNLSEHGYDIIALVKPQFESYLEEVEDSGIITSLDTHYKVVQRVCDECSGLGLSQLSLSRSPITGTKGNREYLLHLRSGAGQKHKLEENDIQSIIYG